MTSVPTSGTKRREYTVIVATREAAGVRQFAMVRHVERGWELPGGKFEGNEGPVHCALREFREETGHLLADPKFVVKMQKENGMCYVFTGGLGPKVAEVAPREAIDRLAWFDTLPPREELGFPDDPYDEIGDHLGIRFR